MVQHDGTDGKRNVDGAVEEINERQVDNQIIWHVSKGFVTDKQEDDQTISSNGQLIDKEISFQGKPSFCRCFQF